MPPIDVASVMPLLLEACPSFLTAWQEHLAWWGEKARGIFNDTGEFAAHLVGLYAAGTTAEFVEVFDLFERLLADGTAETRGAITVGVLESLQNLASHQAFGAAAFVPWLGPRSLLAWQELDALWQGKQSLADVLRAQRGRE